MANQRTKIKVVNKFHRTETAIFAKGKIITKSQYNRFWRKVCGIANCRCGVDLIMPDGTQRYLLPLDNGSYEIVKG